MAVSRFQAEQGTTVRLRVRFERNDMLFDPFSINRIEIHQRTGPATTALVDTISGASVVQEAQGIYYVDWTIPSTQDVGAYVDRWFFEVDSGDPETSDDATFAILQAGAISIASGYITVEEVRARYLPDTALSDADLAVLIDEATEWVEKYTGRFFGSRSMTIDLDGTGACWIVAPYHVQSITRITVNGSCCAGGIDQEVDVGDYITKGRWIINRDFLPWPYGGYRDGCFICGCPFGDCFPRGQKNITIEGAFGLYEDVPALIRRATGLLVMYGGEDDSRTTPMGFNYEDESKEQHSYGRRATDTAQRIEIRGATGIPEVDSILNLFRGIACRMTVI